MGHSVCVVVAQSALIALTEDSALIALWLQQLDRERSRHQLEANDSGISSGSDSASNDDPQFGASNSQGEMAAQRLYQVEHELDLSQEQLKVCACLTVSFWCSSLSVHFSQRKKF